MAGSHGSNGNGNGHKPPDKPPDPPAPSPAERATAPAAATPERNARNTPVLPDTPLHERELRFVAAYLLTLAPIQAAKAAGYKARSKSALSSMAGQVMARPNVQAELQRQFIRRMERTEITQDRVLRDLDLAAHVDPSDLFDADGKLLPLRMIPRHVREAIIGFRWNKTGTKLVELRLRNNTAFHELLAKHTKVGAELPPPTLADVPAFILPEGTRMRVH